MKFLIAGMGSIGRRHLRNLISLGENDILLFRTNHSTLDLDEFSGLLTFTDLNKALDQKPDGVIISNPTALHMDVAIPAAEAGCVILLEKPVSHNFEGIEKLKKVLSFGEGNLVMGFQFRYHPTLRKVVEWIKAEEIGKPLSFICQWGEYLPDWHPWEDYRQSYAARTDLGGGVVKTLCHPLDYLSWIFGEASIRWAFTGKISSLEIDVEDMAAIHLGYENGVEGSLLLDYFRRPPLHCWRSAGVKVVSSGKTTPEQLGFSAPPEMNGKLLYHRKDLSGMNFSSRNCVILSESRGVKRIRNAPLKMVSELRNWFRKYMTWLTPTMEEFR
jgi:predicted dehydrogenase